MAVVRAETGLPAVESDSGETIHVACAADDRYAVYCAAMIHSALSRCRPRSVTVHFLHPPELSPQTLTRLSRLVGELGGKLRPTAMEAERVKGLHATGPFPGVIWYRVFLPELRPELDRILYLDCDTLIVDSLVPLWETDLEGSLVAAVRNLIEPRLATRHHALGIPPEQPYFNSGVLLLNLERMRRQGSMGRVLEHARSYGSRSIWPDQDSLNYALGAQCRLLHPRWNSQNSFFYWPEAREALGEALLAEAIGSPGIVHFEGPEDRKPWHYLNRHPFRRRYWQHLRATPFPVPSPSGRTWKNVARRYLGSAAYDGLRRAWRSLRRSEA